MAKNNITIKSKEDYQVMLRGGKKLAKVKKILKGKIADGVSAKEIDDLADRLIKEAGAKASFKLVPNYSWATCVNVGAGVVHGIPHKHIVFKKGDVVSVDVGVFYKGFHTDTSFTVGIEVDSKTAKFLEKGKKALKKAILVAQPGKRIYDISKSIQDSLKGSDYTPIKALVGHGIGKELHEDPHIPCFVDGTKSDSPVIKTGNAFAIEVMYTQGDPSLKIEGDNWTISTRDGKLSALFEDTVFIKEKGNEVLTE